MTIRLLRIVTIWSFCILTAAIILAATTRANQPPGAGGGYVLQPDEGEVLFLGNPPGKVIIKVASDKTGSPQMAMGIQWVDVAIPVHLHEHEEEFLFVHRGQGVGILGDQRVPVQAGTTIYIPPGTWHGVENTGPEASQIMWVVTPGTGKTTRLEHFFREAGSPAGAEPKSFTLERLIDLLKKHDMRVPPPPK